MKVDHDRRILDVVLYPTSREQSSPANSVEGRHVSDSHSLNTEKTRTTIVRSLFIPRRLSRYDLIVTREYFSSFGINLRSFSPGCSTKHVTVGLNQSRRLLRTSWPMIDRLHQSNISAH